MEPRFTRGEYWLLENVVEQEFAVGALVGSELEFRINKTEHGLTRTALLETLHGLISSGLIYAKNEMDGLISTYEQIERALNEPTGRIVHIEPKKRTSYGLTQEGGTQWEAFAAPDWQKYIDAGFQWPAESQHRIWVAICGDKAWLERYYDSMCFHRRPEVVLASVEWDHIAPWQATYWKQLDGGHRVRFQAQYKGADADSEPYPPPDTEYFQSSWCAWR